MSGNLSAVTALKADTLNEYTSSNGVQIRGRTSGTAIAAGYVGEQIASTGSTGVNKTGSNGGDVIFDSVGAPSLSLPAGTWIIYGFTGITTTNVSDDFNLRLYNSTTSSTFGGGTTGSSGVLGYYYPSSTIGYLSHSSGSNQTIHLYGTRNGASTLKMGIGGSSPHMSCGYLIAVRIA